MSEKVKQLRQIFRPASWAAALAALLVILGACSEDPAPTCPEQFAVGERCEAEGLECIWPSSRCGTPCRCTNQTGGFFWECQARMCSCVCPCGRSAITSCEALECAESGDTCPASAAGLCSMLCKDSGVPDGGHDAGPDAGDGGRDAAGDAAQDSASDLPATDLALDRWQTRVDRGQD